MFLAPFIWLTIIEPILTANLLKQGYQYHALRKACSNFYHPLRDDCYIQAHPWFKSSSAKCISEPVFYGDLVYKSKEPLESLLLLINSKLYIKVGYHTDIMQHFACLDINPITVCSYDILVNCTMGQAPDSVTTLT